MESDANNIRSLREDARFGRLILRGCISSVGIDVQHLFERIESDVVVYRYSGPALQASQRNWPGNSDSQFGRDEIEYSARASVPADPAKSNSIHREWGRSPLFVAKFHRWSAGRRLVVLFLTGFSVEDEGSTRSVILIRPTAREVKIHQ